MIDRVRQGNSKNDGEVVVIGMVTEAVIRDRPGERMNLGQLGTTIGIRQIDLKPDPGLDSVCGKKELLPFLEIR